MEVSVQTGVGKPETIRVGVVSEVAPEGHKAPCRFKDGGTILVSSFLAANIAPLTRPVDHSSQCRFQRARAGAPLLAEAARPDCSQPADRLSRLMLRPGGFCRSQPRFFPELLSVPSLSVLCARP